jgi:hypothetical protein
VSTDPPTGRRRSYVFPGRQKRLSIRVTDDEYTEIATAADQFGLTPKASARTPRSTQRATRTLAPPSGWNMRPSATCKLSCSKLASRSTSSAPSRPVGTRLGTGTGTVERESWIAPLAYADLAEAVLDEIDRPTRHREHVAIYAA